MEHRLIQLISITIVFLIFFIPWFRKNKKKLITKTDYKERAAVYCVSKKWSKVIDLSTKALNIFQLSIEDEVAFLLMIGNSYYELKEYSLAVEYYNKAFEKVFSYNKEYYCSDNFKYALESLIYLGKIDEAKELFSKITHNKENNKDFRKLFKFGRKNNLVD